MAEPWNMQEYINKPEAGREARYCVHTNGPLGSVVKVTG